ncbi:MAG: cation:proton antiporter family protein [Nitriliruptoraceae bacterium]
MGGTFEQIAAVLAVCVAAGTVALLLRQPLIVGLIAAGIAVGPEVLGLVDASDEIELLAKIGISLLLFVVGLKLDVRLVKQLGPVALATGLGQVVFTSVVGFLIARGLGFTVVPALYIAVALTFSSTIIVVKLLTDKRELDDLHGRIALGFLIVQDIVVVLAMIAITASGDPADGGVAAQVARVVVRATGLLVFVVLFGRFVAPRATHLFARSSELLVLGAIAWAVTMASLSTVLGFSAEVGAFLAGMSLASTPYREAISGRLSTIRDFMLVFFFIELGTTFDLAGATTQLGAAAVFAIFVLVGNPIIVMIIMGVMGYRKKVSFKAGLTVAQISEFSLILAALGASQGHIGGDVVGLVTAVGLITIAVSTYLISASDRLYERLEPLLRPFERRRPTATIATDDPASTADYVVIGLGRLGTTIINELLARGDAVLGVDFDPRSVQSPLWDIPVVYGDAEDPDLPEQLTLTQARWVISTLRNFDSNRHLVAALRHHRCRARIVAAADTDTDAARLRALGVDLVIQPMQLAAGPVLAALHDADQ